MQQIENEGIKLFIGLLFPVSMAFFYIQGLAEMDKRLKKDQIRDRRREEAKHRK